MGGADLGAAQPGYRRSSALVNTSDSVTLHRLKPVLLNFHSLQDLALGCVFRAIGRNACLDATNSGKLLSTLVGVPYGSPSEGYVCSQA